MIFTCRDQNRMLNFGRSLSINHAANEATCPCLAAQHGENRQRDGAPQGMAEDQGDGYPDMPVDVLGVLAGPGVGL